MKFTQVIICAVFFFSSLERAFAVQPQVTFRAYTEGVKVWFEIFKAKSPHHLGPADSGTRIDSIDWTYGGSNPFTDTPFLKVVGSNALYSGPMEYTNPSGQARLSVQAHALESNPPGRNPRLTVDPSGKAEASVSINFDSVNESDKEFTFLIDLRHQTKNIGPHSKTSGGWVYVRDEYGLLGISHSVKAQRDAGTPSILQGSVDFKNLTLLQPNLPRSKTFTIPCAIVTPELCQIPYRVGNPVPKFTEETSVRQILKAAACLELIPSARTEDHISWSDRKTQIHPRVKALEEFRANPAALDRFESAEFKNLITSIIDRKLRIFNQWAIQNFHQELTQQSQTFKDLSRILVSHANPLSYKRMLETFKSLANDLDVRRDFVTELLQINQERRTFSTDPQYRDLLDQPDYLFQTNTVDLTIIDATLKQTEELAQKFENSAFELITERDGYIHGQ